MAAKIMRTMLIMFLPVKMRQVYMLMELEPAKEITGGPWYGADAFDAEFVEVLQKVNGFGGSV